MFSTIIFLFASLKFVFFNYLFKLNAFKFKYFNDFQLPIDIFLPFLFISILYPMIGLYPAISNYLTCCLISVLFAQTSVGFGNDKII